MKPCTELARNTERVRMGETEKAPIPISPWAQGAVKLPCSAAGSIGARHMTLTALIAADTGHDA